MRICKMHKEIQQMNLEIKKKNNTYEIEFPSASQSPNLI